MDFPAPAQALKTVLGILIGLGSWGRAPLPSPRPLPLAPREPLRVLHFGDSHTGSETQQGVLRDGVQQKYGDGGPGYLFPWRSRHPGVAAGASRGWRRTGAAGRHPDPLVGLAGAALEAVRAGERAWLEGSFSRMRLYLLRQPGGGTVRVSADGRRLDERPLAAPCPEVAVVERVLGPAPACHRIQIDTVADGRSRILGLALEGPAGGVYSGLGLDGARASWLLRLPEAVLAAQVGREAPDLIVLAFGTNEATGGGFDPAGYERGLAEVLDRLRRSAPRAALLLVAPPDAAFRDGRPDSLGRIASIQQKEAGLVRAGFVNLRAAMGGAGSIRRWRSAGLARPDLVHFTPLGYSRHARAILTGVIRGLERGQGLEAVRGDARPEASRGPGT